MRLETDRLLIRDWTFDDAEAMFDMYSRPSVHQFLGPNSQPAKDLETYREHLVKMRARHDDWPAPLGVWAITLKSDPDRFVGLGILKNLPDSEKIEIGWHVHPDFQGRGIATEWGHAGLRYGSEVAGLKEIYCIVMPGNEASLAVARKIGLQHIGQTDEYHDLVLEYFFARCG